MNKSINIGAEKIPQNCVMTEDHGLVCSKIEESVSIGNPSIDKSDLFLGHAYLVVIVAVLSMALTQTLKPFIKTTCKEKADAVIRLSAVVAGALIAYTLSDPFEIIDVYLGASAGAINAFVISVFKAKVKKSLGVEITPEPKTNDGEKEL